MKLYRIKNRQSFGFSAENPTGQKNGGTKGKDCEKIKTVYSDCSGRDCYAV